MALHPRAMIIGTAGHVDHGKTRLVEALTGVAGDRLAEERRRGITIDLGYAYAGELGFIDVPGHERFVHTMLAGSAGIDAALLVVAADDGVMPQTAEHAQILDILGITSGVVAITKADLAPDRVPDVIADVAALLAGSALADAPVMPVSAFTGLGIEALRAALLALGPAPRAVDGLPRLAVDRVFTLAGAGLVVTGTLMAGRIAVDDRLLLSPSGIELRVRGLHAQNRPAGIARAGQRVALNITGSRLAREGIARGDWVLHPDLHAPTASLDAAVRLPPGVRQMHLHLGTAHVMASVDFLEERSGAPPLNPAGAAGPRPLDLSKWGLGSPDPSGLRAEPSPSCLVRLTLSRPIGALAGDRLVLRESGRIGGGTVLDPWPPRRGRRSPARLATLAALRNPDPVVALRDLLAQPPGWIAFPAFARARNLSRDQRGDVLAAVPGVLVADLALAPPTLGRLLRAMVEALAAHHAAAPDQPGLQPERLRLLLPGRPPPEGFRALLDMALRRHDLEQDGPWLRLPAHRATLSPEEERLWPRLRGLIAAERFRPPRTRDLAGALRVPEPRLRVILKRLGRMGRVVEVAPDHFFLRETVAEMAGIAAEIAAVEPRGVVTAAALRDRLANGRKVAIHILEFFDRAGLTRRSGDERRVRPDRILLFGPPPRPEAACAAVARPAIVDPARRTGAGR